MSKARNQLPGETNSAFRYFKVIRDAKHRRDTNKRTTQRIWVFGPTSRQCPCAPDKTKYKHQTPTWCLNCMPPAKALGCWEFLPKDTFKMFHRLVTLWMDSVSLSCANFWNSWHINSKNQITRGRRQKMKSVWTFMLTEMGKVPRKIRKIKI